MHKAALVIPGLLLIGVASAWFLTVPKTIADAALPAHEADLDNGKTLFAIGGCASCHAAEGSTDDARLNLEGGHRLDTPFGVFVAPNISSDQEHGIGAWRPVDFVNAMQMGTSPEGEHYYPAFPYTSYAKMSQTDVLDLWAYLQTLPASSRANEPHELAFPFTIRRSLGAWKQLYLDDAFVTAGPNEPILERGRYLAEAPGHCGECHSPRDLLGGLDLTQWMAGAPNPAGRGIVPNITKGGIDISQWSEADIVEYLTSGFTPDYDMVGGSMADVVTNTSQLSDEDRVALARYLLALPERANGYSN